MSTVLVAYSTGEGHTAAVAEFMADVLRAHAHDAEVKDLSTALPRIGPEYEGVLVGGSVHVAKHDKRLVRFVSDNREALERLPSAFFSVSLAASGDETEAAKYAAEFCDLTGWHPDSVELVAGALLYTRYGLLKRMLMKQIARSKPGLLGTDTKRDFVYTDWEALRRFVDDFAARLPAAA